jgi:hypothetical protein
MRVPKRESRSFGHPRIVASVEEIWFRTDDGIRLQGELRLPDGPAVATAVLCHPHPRHGGSKDHPLLWAIRNELAGNRGIAMLGFNFRGVMGSGGSYGGGRDELTDARAAISTVREAATTDVPTVLVGWSFGANVALRLALDDRRVEKLALVGLPLEPKDVDLPPLPEAPDLARFRTPTLLIAGENDEFSPARLLEPYGALFPTGSVSIVPSTDHYFWRRERDAAALIGEFVGSFAQDRNM